MEGQRIFYEPDCQACKAEADSSCCGNETENEQAMEGDYGNDVMDVDRLETDVEVVMQVEPRVDRVYELICLNSDTDETDHLSEQAISSSKNSLKAKAHMSRDGGKRKVDCLTEEDSSPQNEAVESSCETCKLLKENQSMESKKKRTRRNVNSGDEGLLMQKKRSPRTGNPR